MLLSILSFIRLFFWSDLLPGGAVGVEVYLKSWLRGNRRFENSNKPFGCSFILTCFLTHR